MTKQDVISLIYRLKTEAYNKLHETYEKLQSEPKNTLDHTLWYYIDKQYYFDEWLRKECDTLADPNYTEN